MALNYDSGLQIIKDTVVGASDFSEIIGIGLRYGFSIQLDYTSGSGNASLQASNDGVSYTDIASTTRALSGSATTFWDVPACGYQYCRIKYASSANTIYTAKIFKK